jgi:2'-5' RNA ligase
MKAIVLFELDKQELEPIIKKVRDVLSERRLQFKVPKLFPHVTLLPPVEVSEEVVAVIQASVDLTWDVYLSELHDEHAILSHKLAYFANEEEVLYFPLTLPREYMHLVQKMRTRFGEALTFVSPIPKCFIPHVTVATGLDLARFCQDLFQFSVDGHLIQDLGVPLSRPKVLVKKDGVWEEYKK